ncbi:MAG: hypothetical protein AAGP08_17170 [Pseudomonadota bacterium]
MQRVVLKLCVLVAGLSARLYFPYVILGLWNRVFGGWRSVFFCYSGGVAYRNAYAPGPIAEMFRWVPNPIGVLRQGEARALVLASPMTEAEFLDPANGAKFRRFQKRLALIARLLGIRQIHMAGILPSILRNTSAITVHPSQGVTVAVVVAAVETLRARAFGDALVPVILLGGAGFIGQGVADVLRDKGIDVRVVDPVIGNKDFPADLVGHPALLVDLARRGALQKRMDDLWPGLVVLNEVFPEPSRQDALRLDKRGIALWHLAGVPGRVWPSLPGGYGHAIPCCAIHDDNADLQPVLLPLNACAERAGLAKAVQAA